MNGEAVSAVKAEGALPEQPGHKCITAGHIHVGHGPEWRTPVGSYDGDATFDGEIRELILTTERPTTDQ